MPTGITEPALKLLRTVLVRGVADDQPDLTMRQMAVLLTVYITAPRRRIRFAAWRRT